MVRIENVPILAKDEYDNPLPQAHTDDHIIYLSRNNYGPSVIATGIVNITDFDHYKPGNVTQTKDIQAEIYRAPEVILGAGYTYAVDI